MKPYFVEMRVLKRQFFCNLLLILKNLQINFFYPFKIWIFTIILIFIFRYNYNYTRDYTIPEIMWYAQLYEYLYLGILTILTFGYVQL